MAALRKTDSDSNSSEEARNSGFNKAGNLGDEEKQPLPVYTAEGSLEVPDDPKESLRRGLEARQISMIAIGGAIGTGLIIGTGSALVKAGPASIMIAYGFVGLLCWIVMTAIGEMAAWIPMPGGFTPFATRYVDPCLGFALGYTYWFKYIITTPNSLTASALVIQYWVNRERVNPGVWIAVFLVVIVTINYLGIKFFGEFEFVLSSLKVLIIVGLIILSLVLALGGGPDHDRKGFRYWHHPGPFKEYIDTGATGKFLAVWSSMVTAVFAYLGTELVGMTVGEAENPRRNIPRAIRLTFYRILVFYIVLILLLTMIIPYNSKQLMTATKQNTSAAASPFVAAIVVAGIHGLPGFLNACVLLFVFSAANSDLYIASRTLHGLALKGHAPRFLAKTDKRGVPTYALGLSTMFCGLAFLNVSTNSATVFGYFVNLVTIFGLLTWISILVTHIYFIRARKAQKVPSKSLPYRAPLGIFGTYFALFFCILIAFTKNFNVFTKGSYGNFDYKNFITGYLGIPLYLLMIFGYKLIMRSKAVKPLEADLWTDKDYFDRDEAYWKEKLKERKSAGSFVYRYFVSWLF